VPRITTPIITSATRRPVSSAAVGITVEARCNSVSREPSACTKLKSTPATGSATSVAQTSASAMTSGCQSRPDCSVGCQARLVEGRSTADSAATDRSGNALPRRCHGNDRLRGDH
jgi:hypothetical protein